MTDTVLSADATDTTDKTDATATDQTVDTSVDTTTDATDKGGDQGADKTADKTDATTDDWRTRLSGGDDKRLRHLGRYQSETAFVEAALKDREAARNALKPLGDEPTDEEVAAYRKTFGVPDKPEGYLEKLSDGLVVGDDDRPIVDEFLNAMHKTNAPANVTAAALETYYAIVEKQESEIAERVATAKREAEDDLRNEWGGDYRRNVNITQSFLQTLPAEVQEVIGGGFDGKGIPLGNNAAVLRWLAGLALESNPLATVVPGTGANQASAIADEIKKIEDVMRTSRSTYNRDEGMQARYRELLGARDKLGS